MVDDFTITNFDNSAHFLYRSNREVVNAYGVAKYEWENQQNNGVGISYRTQAFHEMGCIVH